MAARRVAYTTAHKITNQGGGNTVKQRIAVLLMLGMAPWIQLHAQEQKATATFKVTARVQAVCAVTASDFNLDISTAQLRTTCTPNSTYDVGLKRNGVAQDYTVFGGVPAAQVVPAGAYAEAITVRVYY